MRRFRSTAGIGKSATCIACQSVFLSIQDTLRAHQCLDGHIGIPGNLRGKIRTLNPNGSRRPKADITNTRCALPFKCEIRTVMQQFRAKRWGRLRWHKQCPATTWAVAPPADSRAHLSGASSRASWCRLPQTIAEARIPTVRRPSPARRVVQPGRSRRIGAGRTMGDAIFSRDRWNDSWQ